MLNLMMNYFQILVRYPEIVLFLGVGFKTYKQYLHLRKLHHNQLRCPQQNCL